ncbi:uncharacterized protein LOC111134166 isoform X4 [Crassostrea virginica]
MLRVAFFLFTFSFFCKFNVISGDCLTDKDCVFHDWMSWQDCSGQCGNQMQIRQREFCCPEHVQNKNRVNCLGACSIALSESSKFDESRPCRVCDEGHLVAASNTCVCNHGYRGPCCGDVVRCSDNPCKHGTCKDTTSSFVCTCDPGYEGVDCDTRKACSGGISCQHGGSCRDTGSPGFQCHCTRKYNGEFCENALTCHDAPCLNGGICTDVGSSFQCKCPYTHTGDVCEAVITCASQPCQHGTCTDSPTGFKCACESSYTGVQCDTDIDQANELLLPEWFPYLEYTLLSMVSLVGVMAMGCFFLKCCQAFGVIGKKDDDDEDHENQYEDYKRYKRDSIVPLDHRKPPSFKIHTGLEF